MKTKSLKNRKVRRQLTEKDESDAKYRGLLEAAPDAMVVVNQSGEIVLLNLQAEKQFGYRRDELLGQKVKNIIPEGFAERLLADARRSAEDALAQQIGTGIELTGRRKDESEFPIEIMLSPLKSNEGVLITAAIRDIRVRKDAEKQLAQMEGRYRGLLEAAPDAMVVVNQSGQIVLLNLQAEKQFGYHRDELLGQEVKNIIPEGFAERLLADALRSEEDALAQQIGTGIELTGRRKDGSEFPIEIMLSPLESAEGVLVTAAVRNISVRKDAEAQFRQAQKMEAIGQLTGGIAHDFNNLLTVIMGYSDLALGVAETDDFSRRKFEQIKKAGARAMILTRQLLTFSRKQVLQPKVLNLNEVIAGIQTMLHRLIGETIVLQTVLAPELGNIRTDAGQMEQVIMNLVVNARDAMPDGGEMTIETNNVLLGEDYTRRHFEVRPGAYVMLALIDKGVGMDAVTKTHLFEPFFTTKEVGKGTGLGLSTVYGIVRESGGTISVDSELGLGTTIRLYFPRVTEAVPEVGLSREPSVIARGSETILLAEDDATVRTLTREVLEGCGYRVMEAGNAGEAIAIAERYADPIPLLITDMVMPGMTGLALAERLAEFRPDMKVLYMSGYTDNVIVHQRVSAGTMFFLHKPFEPSALIRKVQFMLHALSV